MKKKKILQFLLPAMLCAATALTLTGCGTKQQTGVAAMETETATDMETERRRKLQRIWKLHRRRKLQRIQRL